MDRLKSTGSGKAEEGAVGRISNRKKKEGEETRERVSMNWLQKNGKDRR